VWLRAWCAQGRGGRGAIKQLRELVFDSACEDGDVGCVLAVAGDAEAQRAVVGADRHADAHVQGERDIGEDLEHAPAAQV
jgi:hypothetical protein